MDARFWFVGNVLAVILCGYSAWSSFNAAQWVSGIILLGFNVYAGVRNARLLKEFR
jgi:hypothetical protein